MKNLTNKYRQHIFQINDTMNMQVPKVVKSQAQQADAESRIKKEILKRNPRNSTHIQGTSSNSDLFQNSVSKIFKWCSIHPLPDYWILEFYISFNFLTYFFKSKNHMNSSQES